MSYQKHRRWVKTFKPEFAQMVLDGSKVSTIRPFPNHGAIPRIGDTLDARMWSAKPYRSKQVLLRSFKITGVLEVLIEDSSIFMRCLDLYTSNPLSLLIANQWATMDGFKSWEEMYAWFSKNYTLPFFGIRIKWD